jgi:alpha-glucuronidase
MNVGMNATWLGSHLSMSNLYAFGRLAWEPTLDSVEILEDWTRLTFGLSRSVRRQSRRCCRGPWSASR